MLIDDLLACGLDGFVGQGGPCHVVKLPFPVAPMVEKDANDIRNQTYSLVARRANDLEYRLAPITEDGACDGTYAKPPYPVLIFFGPGDTGCCHDAFRGSAGASGALGRAGCDRAPQSARSSPAGRAV